MKMNGWLKTGAAVVTLAVGISALVGHNSVDTGDCGWNCDIYRYNDDNGDITKYAVIRALGRTDEQVLFEDTDRDTVLAFAEQIASDRRFEATWSMALVGLMISVIGVAAALIAYKLWMMTTYVGSVAKASMDASKARSLAVLTRAEPDVRRHHHTVKLLSD